jgi:hypothetical protein
MGGKGSTDSGQELASGIRGIIDDRLNSPQPGDVLGGNQTAGVGALNEGRRLAQIGFKTDDFNTAVEKAEDRAAAWGSGGNVRNKLAQAMNKMKHGNPNWTSDEQAAIQGAITPKPGEQFVRVCGKGDPTAHAGAGLAELGIGSLVGAEGGLGAVAHAAPIVAGSMAARRISDAPIKSSINRARNRILYGGVNPYVPNAAQHLAGAAKLPLIRALTGAGSSSPQWQPQP